MIEDLIIKITKKTLCFSKISGGETEINEVQIIHKNIEEAKVLTMTLMPCHECGNSDINVRAFPHDYKNNNQPSSIIIECENCLKCTVESDENFTKCALMAEKRWNDKYREKRGK